MSMMQQLFHRRPRRERLTDRICRSMTAPKRVLLVDDNEQLLQFFETYITRLFNVDIIPAASVADARARLEVGEVDAAILDVRLTNGDGVALYREISERWPNVECVFLTAYDADNRELRHKIERIGPARIYSKDRISEISFIEKLLSQFGITRMSGPVAAPA